MSLEKNFWNLLVGSTMIMQSPLLSVLYHTNIEVIPLWCDLGALVDASLMVPAAPYGCMYFTIGRFCPKRCSNLDLDTPSILITSKRLII